MKQHIIKKQWDELSEEQQMELIKHFLVGRNDFTRVNIGEMIEFLGDDLTEITNNFGMDWDVIGFPHKNQTTFPDFSGYKKEELCDALWEACKYKITELPLIN